MLLRAYNPEMAETVQEVVDDSYPAVIDYLNDRYQGLKANKVLMCGLPVCDKASRLVTEGLLNAGIAAYREEHPRHFITVVPEGPEPASEDDMIICLTWAQWASFLSAEVTVEEVVEAHASLENPGYIGPRREIRSWLPEGIYQSEYSSDSVVSRAGAFNLRPLIPPVDGFTHQWDMSNGVYQRVDASQRQQFS